MSSAIAASCNSMIKWIVLLSTAIMIVVNTKSKGKNCEKLNRVIFFAILFSFIVAFTSFINSSYPVTSVFKMISFLLPFLAVMHCVAVIDTMKIVNYFVAVYLILFLLSFIIIPFNQFRIVNDDFQGVFNHVNMLGTISTIFISTILYSNLIKIRSIKIVIIGLVLFMVYLSASRTGMLSSVSVVLVYVLFGNFTVQQKSLIVCLALMIFVVVPLLLEEGVLNNIRQGIFDFLWKNSEESVLDSRKGLMEDAYERFLSSKFFGTGFMVPYDAGFRSYALSFDLVVEPGNIVFMLLGDTGIVGTTLFLVLFLVILFNGKLDRIYLIFGAFMVNFGEMVFFSSNNMSVLIYILISLYMFVDSGESNNEIEHSRTCL